MGRCAGARCGALDRLLRLLARGGGAFSTRTAPASSRYRVTAAMARPRSNSSTPSAPASVTPARSALGPVFRDGGAVPRLDLDQVVEGRRRLALENGLLRAAAAGLLVAQRNRL